MINILNINIINSKIFITEPSFNHKMISIKKICHTKLCHKYFYDDGIMLEFKPYNFIYFLKIINLFIIKDSKFNVGYDLYKNMFYLSTNNIDVDIDDDINDDHLIINKLNIEYCEIEDFNKNLINHGGYGKIYEYTNKNVIKLGFLNNALNEIINYLKLIYQTISLNLSFDIIKFNKIILYKNKKFKFVSNDIINQKFFIGIVMDKLTVTYNVPRNILIDFIYDIQMLNKNNIYLIDLKFKNVLWNNVNKRFTLIDFDAIQFNANEQDNKQYISSGYNTCLYHVDNKILLDDTYGLIDIILSLIKISFYDLLVYVIYNLGYDGDCRKFETILNFRLFIKQTPKLYNDLTRIIIKYFTHEIKYKLNKDLLIFILKCIIYTIKIDDLIYYVNKYF
jgi:hypothetical protein